MMLSDSLCRHIAETAFEAIPPAALANTRLALLDAIGVMLAASEMSPEAAPFTALAMASGTGPATLLGRNERTSPALAAFANGALAHALDFEDTFDAAPCHPNAALVPAVLALASTRATTGRELLTAMAIGCDLTCRIASSLTRPMTGWYPPPILGAFGATAATARIIGLDAAATRGALSLVLCQATAPAEIKYSTSTTIRAIREAFPAQAAVVSAQLARDGVVGFETPFEGEGGFFQIFAGGGYDPEVLTDRLGTYFHGAELTFKRWPACRGTHAYIEAALRLREAPGFDWRRITSATVVVGEVQQMLVMPAERKRAPTTSIDAKFSIFFTVALALVRGEVGLDDFDAASRGNADVLAMAARMSARFDPAAIPTAIGGIVEIVFDDGRAVEAAVPIALGHPTRSIPVSDMVEKFVACAERASVPWTRAAAGLLAHRLLTIDDCDDISGLFQPAV
ncbi:MmgE/PrpD family protein [Polymorphobacter megasporae]|nr:MmgE/PrpD family protein [Polymorphobacter megasporae]